MVEWMLVVMSFITTLVMIPLNALLLMLSMKIFKLKDQSYMASAKITATVGAVSFILSTVSTILNSRLSPVILAVSFIFVTVLLALWLIKTNYKLGWDKTALVWLVWFVFSLVVGFIIAQILETIFLAVGFPAVPGALAGFA